MYTKDEMTTLHPAADAKAVASTAVYEHEIEALAHVINTAANTGELTTAYLSPVSEEALAELKSKGYSVRYSGGANKESSIVISWEK